LNSVALDLKMFSYRTYRSPYVVKSITVRSENGSSDFLVLCFMLMFLKVEHCKCGG